MLSLAADRVAHLAVHSPEELLVGLGEHGDALHSVTYTDIDYFEDKTSVTNPQCS